MRLSMLTYDMQWILREALAYGVIDFSVICTYRNKADQEKAYSEKKSKVRWPDSKHNKWPAQAADCVPYVNGKISWNKLHCCVLAGVILAAAARLGKNIRWGGDWDQDGVPITDQDFQDLVHYEEML